ncbi:pectinesterase family protein [Paenibacillus sp. 32352]|uniref:pectinesterase family protein n=1 Tax=Paenibacillus sp. 32352 TaxID=1969111 RepID=UPI0009ABD5B7|nr:pectinesterase family protein [Paenibacillus sp. 32352]
MKKVISYALIAAMLASFVPGQASADTTAVKLPAFPGAEGGGKYTTGGRGQEVYIVNTLADYSKNEAPIPGSLRDAVSQSNRTIVFRVGGTIHLKESLKISGSNITIAGQTAPGDGITVSDYTTSVEADNVIIRYLRFRLGDRFASEDDAFGIRYHKDIIIDHCSFSWSVDEVVSLYENTNTTVQWSISEESMLMTSHQKGRHGYGGIWGGNNATFHHNLIAHSVSRNPRFPTIKQLLDITDASNNVIYNWGIASSYGGGEGYYNLDSNYYKYGPNTYRNVRNILFLDVIPESKMYFNGNYMDGDPAVTADNWKGVQTVVDLASSKQSTRADVAGYVPESAQDAYANVLANAGATLPKRDAIDARVINDVKNRTGQHINSPKEVGGFAEYPEVRSSVVDQDGDGMDDAWETAHGLSPSNPDDRNSITLSPEGYTNLEVYLNDLVVQGNASGSNTDNPTAVITSPANNTITEAGSDVVINASADDKDGIAKVEFFIDGTKVGEDTSGPYSFTWTNVEDGTHYVVARAIDNSGVGTQSDNVTVHVNTTTTLGPWQAVDIGSVGIPGHTQLGADAKTVTVKSPGDVGGNADAFLYAYQKQSGNGEIIARVEHVTANDDNAEAGVMIRESLDPSSKMAFLSIPYVKMGKKGVMITRDADGGNTARIEPDAFINTPYWVKLVRLGDHFTGLISQDAVNWQKIGTVTIDMPDEVFYGLAADASKADNDINKYNTSNFSGVELHAIDPDFPAEPTGLTGTPGDKSATLTWNVDASAESYNVKRGDMPGGPYTAIATGIVGTNYTDTKLTPGKAYYYVISAVNSKGESFTSSEVSVEPTGEPEPIYYVDEDFENVELNTTPALYEVSPNPQTDKNKVVASGVPADSTGNSSAKALYLYDRANVNTQFIRKFTPQYGTVIIETDFYFPEESGTSVPLQVQSADGQKTAFTIEVRKPTSPAASGSYTLTYNKGSSNYYKLMDPPQSTKAWHNLKLVANAAADSVDIYIDDAFVQTFAFTTTDFKKYGIGRILSKTPGGGNGSFYFDNLKVYVEPAETPKGLMAVPGNGAVQLTWVEPQGAESYNIKRSETNGGPYSVIQTNVTGSSFIDTTVTNDTVYYYVITANGVGGETGNSNQVQVMPTETAVKPPAPEGLKAVSRNAQIDLSWNPLENANYYTVKKASQPTGSYEVVATNIKGTAYRIGGLTNDSLSSYVVTATSVAGEGPASQPITIAASEPLGTPQVTAVAASRQIALQWPAVPRADHYVVKRSSSPDGAYSVIAPNVTGTSFKDTNLEDGKPYYYKVSAAGLSAAGLDSDIVAIRPGADAGQPGIPAGLKAEAGEGSVTLNWSHVTGAASYQVVRSTSPGGPYSVAADGVTGGTFTDTGLTLGTTYYYAVSAINENGSSYPSIPVKAIPAKVIVVSQNSAEPGDYTTITDAINQVQDNSAAPTIIRVKNGVYKEKVNIGSSKNKITMIGESREGTILVNGDSAKTPGPGGTELGTNGSYTLKVSGTDFTLENMTVENSAGLTAGQAVALYSEGDRGIYRNVKLLGYQDTLFADKGRQYFVDSYIAGSVDYIFGSSPAVFENGILHSRASGYVTAASSNEGKPGYLFLNSTLTSEPGLTAQVELGRPWRPYASVTYVNSTMGDHIKTNGWNNWGNTSNEATARFAEYASKGPGANAGARYTWSKQLTAAEAEQFTVQSTLGGTDNWNPKEPVWLIPGIPNPPKPGQGATGITVDQPTVQLEAGDSVQVHATVLPETVDQKVVWSGGNDAASVSAAGLISGLKPGTAKATVTSVTYSTYSADVNVTVVDTKAPEWKGGSLSIGSITSSSAALSWPAAADYVGVTGYNVYVNGKPYGSVQGNVWSLVVGGLKADSAYTFLVKARDGAGNESAAGLSATATTAKASVDPDPNPKPGQGATGITIDQPAVQLEAGDSVQVHATVLPETVDQKVVWSGGNDAASVSAAGLISGLKPGTAKATVTSVTYSTYSTDVSVTVVDTKAPEWNGGTLNTSVLTNTSVVLSWPAAKDYVGVTKYKLVWNNNNEVVVDGNVLSYKVTGLLPAAPYTFQLTAIDAAGNTSQALTAAVRTHGSSNGRGPSTGGSSGGSSGGAAAGGNGETSSGSPAAEGQVKLPANAMQVKNETLADGTVVSKVTVDGVRLAEALNQAAKQKSSSVVLDLNTLSAVNIELPSQVLINAGTGSPNAVVVVNTSTASYELPLKAVSGLAAANSKDAAVHVSIAPANQQAAQRAEAQAKQLGGTMLTQPMEYRLTLKAQGAEQELKTQSYSAKTMVLPKAVDPNKVTGVIINPATGQMRFVPTLFVTENGVTKATWLHPGNGVYAVIESSKAFEDLKGHWAQKEVELLASKWVVQGSSETTFEPNRSISRAEFASILVRSLGLDENPQGAAYHDVDAHAWYAGAVGAAAAAGLVQGYETGQFQPDATITREQMAVMIARAANYAGMATTETADLSQAYADASSISGWAHSSVGWSVKAGIMQGTGERSFAPGELATRAQAAVMLKRMLQHLKFMN